MSIIDQIKKHDAVRDAYVANLEARVRELEREKSELLKQLVDGVRTREAATLALIMSGALRKP